MNACASLAPIARRGSGSAAQPMVLLDGAPAPELTVRRYRADGATDRRVVWIEVHDAPPGDCVGRDAVVALALRLHDDTIVWRVLAAGTMQSQRCAVRSGGDERWVELADRFGMALDRVIDTSWRQEGEGDAARLISDRGGAVLHAGAAANRSHAMWTINGERAHVLQRGGDPWTVGSALAALSAFGGLGLSLTHLPSEIADAALSETVDLSRSMDVTLGAVLDAFGLVVRREMRLEAGALIERRTVRPIERGRSVRLAWRDDDDPLGQVARLRSDAPARGARRLIARAPGPRVEGTFVLRRGWDPSLEGQADEVYSRATNTSFADVANVFRRWVLNEDGRFSGAPYLQGDAFDLAALFAQPGLAPRALRLLPCLTLDDAGAQRAVNVQVSTDSGQTWAAYAGRAVIATDRAAVYLDDATLDSGFLAAAQAGTAQVRVTASLQSPRAHDTLRWHGNPFAGRAADEVTRLGPGAQARRIDASSVHAGDVAAGALNADVHDPTHEVNRLLTTRLLRARSDALAGGGRGSVRLIDALPLLTVGDRIADAGGAGRTLRGQAQALTQRAATVLAVQCDWPGEGGATTTLEVRG